MERVGEDCGKQRLDGNDMDDERGQKTWARREHGLRSVILSQIRSINDKFEIGMA